MALGSANGWSAEQADVRSADEMLARHMPGFHWMTSYGDHLKEIGYALKKVSIEWDCLG